MLENITQKLGSVFDKIRGRGALTEKDVDATLSEVRKALLEADVAIEAVKVFIENTRKRAVGTEVLRSITPGQMVVKVVHDELVILLGNDEDASLNIDHSPPATILLAGLQGSGKTTTAGKLALWIKNKKNKKVLLASLDTYRPAARDQLRILGEQAGVSVLPEIDGETPASITKRAKAAAKVQGTDVLILDTAGRQSIDTVLMSELKEINAISNPSEILLVADAMTGQDAVNTAKVFHDRLNFDGVILTKLDGDARGGAALSIKSVVDKPIKFIGTGENLDALDVFYPDRMAERILGMGDVVSLVERAQQAFDEEEAKKIQLKVKKNSFGFDDFLSQIKQVQKMGSMKDLVGMIPGANKISPDDIDEDAFKGIEAIIQSMTPKERSQPKLLNHSRKKRIASGSGTKVEDVNRLIKQFEQMQKMMKMVQRGGAGKLMQMMKGI